MENSSENTWKTKGHFPTESVRRTEVTCGATSPVSADPSAVAEVPHLLPSSSGDHAALPDAQQSCTAAADNPCPNTSSSDSVESAVLESGSELFGPPKVNVGLDTVKSKQAASITNKPFYVKRTYPNHPGSDSALCSGSESAVLVVSEGADVGATGNTNAFSAVVVTQPGPPIVLHSTTLQQPPHTTPVGITTNHTYDNDVVRDANLSSVSNSDNLSSTLPIHSSRRPRSTILSQATTSFNFAHADQEQDWESRPLKASLSMSSLSQVEDSDAPPEPNPMLQSRYKSPFAQRRSRYSQTVYTSRIAQHAEYTPHPTVLRTYTTPSATIHHHSSHSSLYTDPSSDSRSKTLPHAPRTALFTKQEDTPTSHHIPPPLPVHPSPYSPSSGSSQSRKLPQVPLVSPTLSSKRLPAASLPTEPVAVTQPASTSDLPTQSLRRLQETSPKEPEETSNEIKDVETSTDSQTVVPKSAPTEQTSQAPESLKQTSPVLSMENVSSVVVHETSPSHVVADEQSSIFSEQSLPVFAEKSLGSADLPSSGEQLPSYAADESDASRPNLVELVPVVHAVSVAKNEGTPDEEDALPLLPNLGTHPLLTRGKDQVPEVIDQKDSNVSALMGSKPVVIDPQPGMFPLKSLKPSESYFQNLLLEEQNKMGSTLTQLPSNDSSVQVTSKENTYQLPSNDSSVQVTSKENTYQLPSNDSSVQVTPKENTFIRHSDLNDPIRVFVGKSLTDLRHPPQSSHLPVSLGAYPSPRLSMASSVEDVKTVNETSIFPSSKLVATTSKYLSSQAASNVTKEKAASHVSVPDLSSKVLQTSPDDTDSERSGSVVDIRKLIKAFEGNNEPSLKAKPFELDEKYQSRSYQQKRPPTQDEKKISGPLPQPLIPQIAASDKRSFPGILPPEYHRDDAKVLGKEPIGTVAPVFRKQMEASRAEEDGKGMDDRRGRQLQALEAERRGQLEDDMEEKVDEEESCDLRQKSKPRKHKEHGKKDEKGLRIGGGRKDFIAEEMRMQKEKEKELMLQRKKLQQEYKQRQQQQGLRKQKEELQKEGKMKEEERLKHQQERLQRAQKQEQVQKSVRDDARQKLQREQELQKRQQEQELERQRKQQELEKQRQEKQLERQREERELERQRKQQEQEKQRQEKQLKRQREERELERQRKQQELEKKWQENELEGQRDEVELERQRKQELEKQWQEKELERQREEKELERQRKQQELERQQRVREVLSHQEQSAREQWILEQQKLLQDEREEQQRYIEEHQKLLLEEKRKIEEQRERLEKLEKLHQQQLEWELHKLRTGGDRQLVPDALQRRTQETFLEQVQQQPNSQQELELLEKVHELPHQISEQPQQQQQETSQFQHITQTDHDQPLIGTSHSQQQKETAQAEQQKETAQVQEQKDIPQAQQHKEVTLAQQQTETVQAQQQEETSQAQQHKEIPQAQQHKEIALAQQQIETAQAHQQEETLKAQQQKETAQALQQKETVEAQQQKKTVQAQQQKETAKAQQQKETAQAQQQKETALAQPRQQSGQSQQQQKQTDLQQQMRHQRYLMHAAGEELVRVVKEREDRRQSARLEEQLRILHLREQQEKREMEQIQKIIQEEKQRKLKETFEGSIDKNEHGRAQKGKMPARAEPYVPTEGKHQPPGRPTAPLPDDEELADSDAQKVAENGVPKVGDKDAEKLADIDVQKVAESDVQKVTESDVQKVVDKDAQKIADSHVKKVVESDVQKVTENDVQKVVDKYAQKVADSDVQKVAESDVQKVAESDVQKVVDKDAQKVADIDVQKMAESDVQKVTESDVQKVVARVEPYIPTEGEHEPPGRPTAPLPDDEELGDSDAQKVVENRVQKVGDKDAEKLADIDVQEVTESDVQNVVDKDARKVADSDVQKVTESDVPKVVDKDEQEAADRDVQNVAGSYVQKVSDKDIQMVADSDVLRVTESYAQKVVNKDVQKAADSDLQKVVSESAEKVVDIGFQNVIEIDVQRVTCNDVQTVVESDEKKDVDNTEFKVPHLNQKKVCDKYLLQQDENIIQPISCKDISDESLICKDISDEQGPDLLDEKIHCKANQEIPVDDAQEIPNDDDQKRPAKKNQKILVKDKQKIYDEHKQKMPAKDDQKIPVQDKQEIHDEDKQKMPAKDDQKIPVDDEQEIPDKNEQQMPSKDDQKILVKDVQERFDKNELKVVAKKDEKIPIEDKQDVHDKDEQKMLAKTNKKMLDKDRQETPEKCEQKLSDTDKLSILTADKKMVSEHDEQERLHFDERQGPGESEAKIVAANEEKIPETNEQEMIGKEDQNLLGKDEQKIVETIVQDDFYEDNLKTSAETLVNEPRYREDHDEQTSIKTGGLTTELVVIGEQTPEVRLGEQSQEIQPEKQKDQPHDLQQEKQKQDQREETGMQQELQFWKKKQVLQESQLSDDSDSDVPSVSQLRREQIRERLVNDRRQQLLNQRQEQQKKQQEEYYKQLEEAKNSQPAIPDGISRTDDKVLADEESSTTTKSALDENVLGNDVPLDDDKKSTSSQVEIVEKLSRDARPAEKLFGNDNLSLDKNFPIEDASAKQEESLDTVSIDDYHSVSEGKPHGFDDLSSSGDDPQDINAQTHDLSETVTSNLSLSTTVDASNIRSTSLDFSLERGSIAQQSLVQNSSSPSSTLSDTEQDYGDFTIDDSGDETSTNPALANSASPTLSMIQLQETLITDSGSPESNSELTDFGALSPDSTPPSGDTPSTSDSAATAVEVTTHSLPSDEQGEHEEQHGEHEQQGEHDEQQDEHERQQGELEKQQGEHREQQGEQVEQQGKHLEQQCEHKEHSTPEIQLCRTPDGCARVKFSTQITIIPSIEISDTSIEETLSSDAGLIIADSSQVVSSLDKNSHIPNSKDHDIIIPEVIPISCKVKDEEQVIPEVSSCKSVNNDGEILSFEISTEKAFTEDQSVQRKVDSEANRMLASERDVVSIDCGTGPSDDPCASQLRMEEDETEPSNSKVDVKATRQASVESNGVGSGRGIIPVVEVITPSAFESDRQPPVFDGQSPTSLSYPNAVLKEDPSSRRCPSGNDADFGDGASETRLREQTVTEGEDPSVYSSNFDTSVSMYTNLATEGTPVGQGSSAVETGTFGGSLESFPLNSDDMQGAMGDTGSIGANNSNNNNVEEYEMGSRLPKITNGGGGGEGDLPRVVVDQDQGGGYEGGAPDHHLLGGGGCPGSVRSTPPKSPITVQEWVASLPFPTPASDVSGVPAWEATAAGGAEEGAEGGHEDGGPHDDLNLGAEAHLLAGGRTSFGGLRDCALRLPPDRSDCLIRTQQHQQHQQLKQQYTADQDNTRPTTTTTLPQLALNTPSTQHSQLALHLQESIFQPVSSAPSILRPAPDSAFSAPLTTCPLRAKWGQLAARTIEEQQETVAEQQSDSRDEGQEHHQQQLSSQQQCIQEYELAEPASAISAEKRQLLSGLRSKQHSFNSEASALSCNSRSSLESLLDARQNDAVEVLLSLGFGGRDQDQDPINRIPSRFLDQPSQVRGNDLTTFLEQEDRCQQLLETNDWLPGLSYQGLRKASMSTSPLLSNLVESFQQSQYEEFDELDELPPNANKFASLVNEVRKKGRLSRRSKSEQNLGLNGKVFPSGGGGMKRSGRLSVGCGWGGAFSAVKSAGGSGVQVQDGDTGQDEDGSGGQKKSRWLSVLTPENRNFLQNQGRKSPEMVSRKLILGQSSFDLGKNGELLNEKNKPKSPVLAANKENKENSQSEEQASVAVERHISVESNSDSSSGSFHHKKTQRNSSVWSMASSLTSIDSNEEEMLEQRRLLNLQISKNKNNRQDEDLVAGGLQDKDTLAEASSTSLGVTSHKIGEVDKATGHKKLRRTSTPKRFRTTSMSNSSTAGVKEVGDTIEEEMFFSDGEGHPVRDNSSKNTNGGEPEPSSGGVSFSCSGNNKSVLHASASFPLLDRKRPTVQLRGIKEGCTFESFGSLTAAGSLDHLSQPAGREAIVTSKPPLDTQRRGRLERQRTVRDQYVQNLPGQWSKDSAATVRLRRAETSGRSADFYLWHSNTAEEPATANEDYGSQDGDGSALSDRAVGRQSDGREDVLNKEGQRDDIGTTCSGCGGILVCLRCRVGGGSGDSKNATAGERVAESCETFYSVKSSLREGIASDTQRWDTSSKDPCRTFVNKTQFVSEDQISRGIDANFVRELREFISKAVDRLELAKSCVYPGGDDNQKFEERPITSPILKNQSEISGVNVLCNNSTGNSSSSKPSKASRKARRRKSKMFIARCRTMSTSSAEEALMPDPPASSPVVSSPSPSSSVHIAPSDPASSPAAANIAVVPPTRRRVPLKFAKGSRSFSEIGDPPSDAAPHTTSTDGGGGQTKAALSGGPSNDRSGESGSSEIHKLLGLFSEQLRVCERLQLSLSDTKS